MTDDDLVTLANRAFLYATRGKIRPSGLICGANMHAALKSRSLDGTYLRAQLIFDDSVPPDHLFVVVKDFGATA